MKKLLLLTLIASQTPAQGINLFDAAKMKPLTSNMERNAGFMMPTFKEPTQRDLENHKLLADTQKNIDFCNKKITEQLIQEYDNDPMVKVTTDALERCLKEKGSDCAIEKVNLATAQRNRTKQAAKIVSGIHKAVEANGISMTYNEFSKFYAEALTKVYTSNTKPDMLEQLAYALYRIALVSQDESEIQFNGASTTYVSKEFAEKNLNDIKLVYKPIQDADEAHRLCAELAIKLTQDKNLSAKGNEHVATALAIVGQYKQWYKPCSEALKPLLNKQPKLKDNIYIWHTGTCADRKNNQSEFEKIFI